MSIFQAWQIVGLFYFSYIWVMENVEFKLDTKEIEAYSKKLGTLHKSAYPSAVRATLNGAAFDVKQKTLLKSAKDSFIERQANFFKANSTVDVATGFNVDTMKATVGMSEERLKDKSTNYAVKDLEQQEHGGKIGGKSFIPMKTARVSKSANKIIQQRFRISDVLDENKFLNVNNSRGKTKKQRYVKTAIKAFQLNPSNAYILGNSFRGGNRTLSKIEMVSFTKKGIKIRRTPIYTYRKGREITVAGKNFMKRAAFESSLDMNKIFKKEAEFQFKKHLG